MSVNVEGYDVLELVGSGGYSRVYRARQSAFNRIVALKILESGFESDEQRHRFERECRAMGVLGEHPNIVTVFDTALTSDGRGCIVMEYYGGGTLGDRLGARGAIGAEELLPIGVQIAGALETAHRRGVVHRDLKPHNLFLSDYGQAALGDFGISSFVDDRTVIGGGAGLTVHYAPPEVIEGGIGSAAGDVYSLAATLYTLLSGTRPFPRGENQTVADLARRILFEPAPRLDDRLGPGALADLLVAAMSKSPADRPQSAEELGGALRSIQEAEGWVVTPLPLSRESGEVASEPEPYRPGDGAVAVLDSPDLVAAVEADLTAATRPRLSVAAPGERVEVESAPAGERLRRWLPIGLSVAGALAVVGLILGSALGDSRSGGESEVAVANVPTTDVFFGAPERPTDIRFRLMGEDVEVSWSEVDRAIAYQVRRVGSADAVTEVAEPLAVFAATDVTCVEVVAVGEAGHLSAPSSAVCRTNDNGTG